MRFLPLAMLLLAAIAPSQPASAQRDPARSLRLEGEPDTPADHRLLQRFSHCVAQRQPGQAATLLATDYRTPAYLSAMRRLAQNNSGCVPLDRARFSSILFAGGMAEALLRRQSAATDLAVRTALDPARPLQALDETDVMSICLVRAAPSQAEALLASNAGSPQEAAALTALMPHVGDCLAAGMRLRLNRPGLRAMVALAAYRLVQHNARGAQEAAR